MNAFRALLLSSAALAFAAPAFAADLTYEAPPAASTAYAPPAGFSWTGPYMGAVIGYGSGTVDANDTPGDVDVDGFEAGVYGGYNMDLGNQVVLGVEGDILWSGVEGDPSDGKAEEDFNSTLRARAGYAVDRYMFYGTGGLAVSHAKVEDNLGASDSNTHVGFVVGAGAEAAITNNVIAKIEYQYQDYGKETYDLTNPTDVDYSTHSIRAGIGLKF